MEKENIREEYPSYKIICRKGSGEYEEKKSRFIANVVPVSSVEEAAEFIESMRKKYYDARHNCSAFIIGRNSELTRCSDDGEPGGTAGKPMLEVLLGAGVTNVAAVVTRYFGGTLLGTGGLVRAYTQAVKEALADAETAIMRYGVELTIAIEYTDIGRIQHLLESRQIEIQASRYTDKVEFDISIPDTQGEELFKEITDKTGGRAGITVRGKGYYKE